MLIKLKLKYLSLIKKLIFEKNKFIIKSLKYSLNIRNVSYFTTHVSTLVGYFDLIDRSEKFVFLDDVQFDSRSWQQRNRRLPIKKLYY